MAVRAMGTRLYFTPQGGARTAVGRLSSIGELRADSDEIDVTTLDSETRTYIQGRRESARLELKGFLDAGDAGQSALCAAYDSAEAGRMEILFPDGTTAEARAFVKAYAIGAAEVDGAVGFQAVLRPVSAITVTTDTKQGG